MTSSETRVRRIHVIDPTLQVKTTRETPVLGVITSLKPFGVTPLFREFYRSK
jgi:hypothetical protein